MTGEQLLIEGAAQLGLNLSKEAVNKFNIYGRLLASWNERLNLTAISSEEGVAIKHFLDSLSIINAAGVEDGTRIVDIGTGAGFPGVPLKIMLPSSSVFLIDSLAKRVSFLNELISALDLNDIRAAHIRAEDGGRDEGLRDSFDLAASRAVARLRELCEYCLPYVKRGGIFVAMKGNDINEELEEAKPAIKALNAEVSAVKTLTLPFSDYKRKLIVIRKLGQTPHKFPRKQAQILKFPII